MSDEGKSYLEKLRDPRWQKRRLQIYERDDWTCQICFDTEGTLHVHHRYYENGEEPWEADDRALVTLCEPCHRNQKQRRQADDLILQVLRHHLFSAEVLEMSHILERAFERCGSDGLRRLSLFASLCGAIEEAGNDA